ncbi:hypothetical protein OHA84_10655 [Streptomyces sp. NBC_00513]|uniref:hypothetical protein n=1 Tax=unclassified Streptomyces TaxID=2593676 RepID=UPI0022563ADC|nr:MULTISPECIES: hypothetical protein [unclassified Streptomyces]MCX5075995.1 hypothetical protein [Streptomyces sp. NBC_00424]MCX5152405.1 hypothetical protein [Streptomyces sp. NBC_00291]WUD40937.1 hypothetical protein OHA84_10655 [Streptomyces sp. NBC_00513]
MLRRFSTALATTATAAAALLLATSATATAAAAAPGFLGGADLPPHPSSPWYAGKVTKGLPEFAPFCLEGVLPAAGSWHRDFGTDYDTGATQISVRTASNAAAAKLATALERKVAACAADWLRTTPGGTASWQDYGKLPVEEGAHVYGVHTSVPDSEPGVHLYGIGRDGVTVTVVKWGQMGDLGDAPVPAFKKTTTTAVNKLNP